MLKSFTDAFHIGKSKFELYTVLVRLALGVAEPIAEYVKRDSANRMVETEQIRLRI